MATGTVTFDFVGRGAGTLARDFKQVGDNAANASRGAAVLQRVIGELGTKENRTAKESALLARALRMTGDAEDRVAARAVAADLAVRRLDDAMDDLDKSSTSASTGLNLSFRNMSLFQKAMLGLNLATGLAEPAVAALTVAVGGLSSALAVAGAGAGAYGIAAAGLIKQVSDLEQAQAKLGTGSKATQQANQKLYDQMRTQAPPAVRAFQTAFDQMKKSYGDWANSLATPVMAPLTTGLKTAAPALHAITPLVRASADAFHVLMTELSAKIDAGGLTRVVQTILPYVRPVTLDLGHAIANVTAGLWGILRAFLPFSTEITGGLVQLTARFKEWATTLSGHTGFQALVDQWRRNWPLMREGLGNLATILKNILGDMAGLATPANSRALWQIANPLLALAARLSANPALVTAFLYLTLIGKGASQITGVFNSLKSGWGTLAGVVKSLTGGRISLGMETAGGTMLQASRNMLVAANTMAGAAGKGGVAGKAGGLVPLGAGAYAGMAAAAAAAAAAWIATFRNDLRKGIIALAPDISRWFGGVGGGGIGGFFSGAAQNIANLFIDHFRAPIEKFTATPRRLVTAWFRNSRDWLVGSANDLFGGMWAALRDMWGRVTRWAANFPHWSAGWFRSADRWLISGGRNIITGLWHGIQAIWANVTGWFHGMPGRVGGFFHGALGWLFQSGRNVIWGLYHGLLDIWHHVTSFITGIPGWIRAHKGPLSLDQKLLIPAGRAIMESLHTGLLLGSGGPLGFVSGLAGTIGGLLGKGLGWFKNLFTGGGGGGRGGGYGGYGVPPRGPLQAYAMALLRARGWGNMWAAFNALVMGESGWNPYATNPSSGAYGIPQALPAGKMAAAGADWRTSGFTQLRWMMGYIASTYGNPARAYAMWLARSPHWYGSGGLIPEPVLGVGRSGQVYGFGERGPELVVPAGARGGGGTTIVVNVTVGHGTPPVAAAREIAALLNAGAASGVRLRRSILTGG